MTPAEITAACADRTRPRWRGIKFEQVPVNTPAPKNSPPTMLVATAPKRYAYWSHILRIWIIVLDGGHRG